MNRNLCLLLLSSLGLVLTCIRPSNAEFPGMFVFGNSIFDNGNNDYLLTRIKANHLPYGIDFPSGPSPTGRFTNGKNLADLIGDPLGLPLLPSFSDPLTKGIRVSRGVNHASAGSGILDSTASSMGIIGLNQQFRDFVEVTFPMLKTQLGCPRSTMILRPYLYLVSTGSDDFLFDFFKGGHDIGTLEYFSNNLIASLANQVTTIYNSGGRKVVIVGMGPIGCTPMVRATMPNKDCNETLNYAAYYFNTQLLVTLNKSKREMSQLQFVVVNLFQLTLEFIRYPSSGGFTDVKNSCCEVTQSSDGYLCKEGGKVCPNRKTYLYFDGQNPTEAFYRIVAARAYNSTDTSEVSPYNIQTLLAQV